jgi:hypothetical protein
MNWATIIANAIAGAALLVSLVVATRRYRARQWLDRSADIEIEFAADSLVVGNSGAHDARDIRIDNCQRNRPSGSEDRRFPRQLHPNCSPCPSPPCGVPRLDNRRLIHGQCPATMDRRERSPRQKCPSVHRQPLEHQELPSDHGFLIQREARLPRRLHGLQTGQAVTEDEPHPAAELVTIAGRLRATSSSPAVPRRALSIGRQRSSTDDHGPCVRPSSCRISPSRAARGCFPSSR